MKEGYPSTIYTVLKTSQKVKIKEEYKDSEACFMCMRAKDETLVLESGFDKELIGSDPGKLSIEYLQGVYNETAGDTEKGLCYGCKKIVNNSDKDKLFSVFPLV